MQTNMQPNYGVSKGTPIQRSTFDCSHTHKTCFDENVIVPIYSDQAYPGDTFKLNMSAFCRMATPIYPLMDNLYIDFFFFEVPLDQIWDDAFLFFGEQQDPADDISSVTVPMTTGTISGGSFQDHLGLPIGAGVRYSDLYERSYRHIWNEFFRDENLQDKVSVSKGQSAGSGNMTLLNRGKRHDYLTSCLPWPMKPDGTGDVLMPLGTQADVLGIGPPTGSTYTGTNNFLQSDGTTYTTDDVYSTTALYHNENTTDAGYPGIYADLTNAAAATYNEVRAGLAIVHLLEKDARNGTRYNEICQSHFGVSFPTDIYRPIYLGGGSMPVSINSVPQTSSTDATTPQGNLAAYATAGTSGIGFTKSFNRHSIVMGFASVRADLTYQKSLERRFSDETRYDWYWPDLQGIGEQAVLNKEVYYSNSSVDNDVFGYQERYAHLKFKHSLITNKMRSDATGTLEAWHLSQDFTSLPVLDTTFIQEDVPMGRVLAISSEPHFIFDSYFDYKCTRPMQMYGKPGLTHF